MKKITYIVVITMALLMTSEIVLAKNTHNELGQPIVEREVEIRDGQKITRERISGGEWRIISSTPLINEVQVPAPINEQAPAVKESVVNTPDNIPTIANTEPEAASEVEKKPTVRDKVGAFFKRTMMRFFEIMNSWRG